VQERITYGVGQDANGPVYKLQHYGVDQGQLNKHFREEWSETATGQWIQSIIGPFEDLRYQCTAPFIFNQWDCTVMNAPKPVRDSNRTDYDVLDRNNAVQITPDGWVQNERNLKHTLAGVAVASEVGWIEYKAIDDSQCPTDLP